MTDATDHDITRTRIAVEDLEMVTDALAARALPFRDRLTSTGIEQAKRDLLAERIRVAARELHRAAWLIGTGLDVTQDDLGHLAAGDGFIPDRT
jgi:hypothetical protein